MKHKLFLFLLLISLKSVAQVRYEKGYVVTNDNQRIECLIKNRDWLNNPQSIEYKVTEADSVRKGNTDNVKEFGITGFFRYIKAEVNIDRSPVDIDNLSFDKKPMWSKEKLYLKMLVNAKIKLYAYKEGNVERFFYSVNDSLIEQLIYKEYLSENEREITNGTLQQRWVAKNETYKQQLWNNVRNDKISMNDVMNVKYLRNDMVKYFMNVNNQGKDSSIVCGANENRSVFNLKITPGINYSSISLSTSIISLLSSELTKVNIDFGRQVDFRLGFEAEYILPFNRNVWSVFVEPSYQYYNKSKNDVLGYNASVNFNIIDFPIGFRRYIYLNDNCKFYLNTLFSVGHILYSYPQIHILNYNLDVILADNFSFGGGIDYKKFSLEYRYYINRIILNNSVNMAGVFKCSSLIIGYKILDGDKKKRTL